MRRKVERPGDTWYISNCGYIWKEPELIKLWDSLTTDKVNELIKRFNLTVSLPDWAITYTQLGIISADKHAKVLADCKFHAVYDYLLENPELRGEI